MTLATIEEHLRDRRDLPPPPLRRALRESAGVSARYVAQHLGVSAEAVLHWEAGRRFPRPEHLHGYVALTASRGARVIPDPRRTPTLSVPDAGRLYAGLGRSASYTAARRGDLPGLIRVGRREVVATAVLLRTLGLLDALPRG